MHQKMHDCTILNHFRPAVADAVCVTVCLDCSAHNERWVCILHVHMVRGKMPPGIVIKWFLAICYKKFRLRAKYRVCVFRVLYLFFWFRSIRFAYTFSFFISWDLSACFFLFGVGAIKCEPRTLVSGVRKNVFILWILCMRASAWIYACAGLARMHMGFCIRRDIGTHHSYLGNSAIVWLFYACEMLRFLRCSIHPK